MHEHAGHRKRIIEKLQKGVLLEHELLEVLLFTALPRKNTNDLAHRLLAEFGSIERVLTAPIERLKQVRGCGDSIAAFLHCVGLIQEKRITVEKGYPKYFEGENFSSFVGGEYGKYPTELLDVYFLEEDGEIFAKKRFTSENGESVELEAQQLTELLFSYKPSGIVLVHNHPFGKATPSSQDDKMTGTCQLICSLHNVLFCDHFIYVNEGVYSYYGSGKLVSISNRYSLKSVMSQEKKE